MAVLPPMRSSCQQPWVGGWLVGASSGNRCGGLRWIRLPEYKRHTSQQKFVRFRVASPTHPSCGSFFSRVGSIQTRTSLPTCLPPKRVSLYVRRAKQPSWIENGNFMAYNYTIVEGESPLGVGSFVCSLVRSTRLLLIRGRAIPWPPAW